MDKMKISEVINCTKGQLINGNLDNEFFGVCQDSRLAKEGEVFVAIKGGAFDGHNYIKNAIDLGCRGVILDNKEKLEGIDLKSCNVILVEDSTKALQDLASYYLSKMNIKVIGVTGSTGKTSTRDMTYYVVSEKYKAAKNRGNFNTVVGVPLTILEMDEDTEIAVLEMGMDRFGEIDALANLTKPEIGLITNIGVSHLEHLGSREGIFKAKMEIVNYFDKDNVLIVTEAEDFLNKKRIGEVFGGDYKVVVTGSSKDCDLVVSDIEETGDNSLRFTCTYGSESEVIDLPVPGRHNAYNATLAIAAGLQLGVSLKEAKAGLAKMELTGKRLRLKDYDGIKVIDDTYNASPDSMKSALDTLKNAKGQRKIAILGDMFELGADEVKFHKEIGDYARERADVIFTLGNLAKNISMENHYEDRAELVKAAKEYLKVGDVVLFKASRGMALDKLIEEIFEEN